MLFISCDRFNKSKTDEEKKLRSERDLTCEKPHPAGAHSSLGSLVHPVMGVYFFTFFLETEHTSRGHLEHLVLVV